MQFRPEPALPPEAAAIYDLVTSIAHELRQPLFAIAASAETSVRWLEHDTPNVAKAAELAHRIAQSAYRAKDILLAIEQSAAGRQPAREPLDLNAVVAEACAFVSDEAEARRIELDLDLAEGLPAVCCDRIQIQQVVVNLVLNAVQAIDWPGARRRRVRLSTSLGEADTPTISVRDTGPGIAEGDFERIFTRFFTTKPDGMGVGLALCRRLIQAHGGDIQASNNPAGGARFDVFLPS